MYRDSRRLRVVLALLILSCFTLITVDYRAGNGTVLQGLRRAAAAVFGPIERGVTSAVRPIGNALSTLGDLGGLHSEVKKLRKENQQLRDGLTRLPDVQRENEHLRALLALAGRGQYRVRACRVVGVGPDNYEWTATVDCGSGDGIKEDMTVLNGDGLVGKVLTVGAYTSQVLLAIDPEFTVAGRLAAHGTLGAVTGNGLGPMRMNLLDAAAKVSKNEPVVSNGTQNGIVYGVPIGLVTKVGTERSVLTRPVEVTPFVHFTALDIVGVVVQPPRRDPRNAVLPAPPRRPAPRHSPSPCPSASPPASLSPSPSPCASASPSATPTPGRTFGPPSPSGSP